MDTEEAEKDETCVVGMRCNEMSKNPLSGSWKAICIECKNDVWISKLWKGKKIKIICDDCCFKKGNKDKDSQFLMTKESLDEIVKWAREYYGDQIIDKSDEDIKFDAIELIENKVKKEIRIVESNKE